MIAALSPDDRAQIGLPDSVTQGVYIKHVYPGSPAAQAGMHIGDVITAANGQDVADTDTLNNMIQTLKVGNVLSLRVIRDGTPRTVSVTLRERPASFGQTQPSQQQGDPQQQQGSPFGFPFGQP